MPQKKKEPQVHEHAADTKEVVQRKNIKLDDSVLINVKSNTYGTLIYVNSRTGDKTEWHGAGDVQQITMGDLRAMKGSQRAFFENQWIYVMGVEDSDYEDVTPGDVYKMLMVSQYYKNVVDPDDFNRIFSMKPSEIKETVSMMSADAKLNLLVAVNTAIEDGDLDSLKKIKVFEEVLGRELSRPE